MHRWGDWPDRNFADVGNAADEIGQFLIRWGRVSVKDTKEKYGTARVYLSFGWDSIHSIMYPGYHFLQFKGLIKTLYYKLVPIEQAVLRPINMLIVPYHIWLYRLAYKRALKKYPHIQKEILGGADYAEYLKDLVVKT